MYLISEALLPNIQLVSVLLEPGERAYSWYQHQKAHAIDAALQFSFYEILKADPSNQIAWNLRQVKFIGVIYYN